MYNYNKPKKTTIVRNESYEGERIEEKVNRIVNNNEPIVDTAPQIFTDRKDGVMPEYDPRTDPWELAVEAMSAVDRTNKAKREERHKPKEEPKNDDKKDGGTEPIQATEPK